MKITRSSRVIIPKKNLFTKIAVSLEKLMVLSDNCGIFWIKIASLSEKILAVQADHDSNATVIMSQLRKTSGSHYVQ